MSKRSIQIERLEIRLKGVAPQSARAVASHLGTDLLGQLSQLPTLSGGRRVVKIGHLDAGTFRLSGETAPSELRHQIARSVAASIKSKLK
jgi:hypothetical protein